MPPSVAAGLLTAARPLRPRTAAPGVRPAVGRARFPEGPPQAA
ncbi:hypothetical protein ACFYZJ_08880 [Streptomyces sp. NPDC001848]